jgi:archaellum biogenesis protein FlaJ (TadC family)
MALFAGNLYYYNQQELQYQTTYDERPQQLTISRSGPAQTVFELEQPQELGSVTVTLAFSDMHQGIVITPEINGKTFETATGLVDESSHTIHVDQQDLQQTNRLRIDGDFAENNVALNNVSISTLTVHGVTGSQRIFFLALNILSIVIAIGPILILKYRQYSKRHVYEEQFPNFLRDVVEGTRAGMSLPHAIKNTRNNNYSDLTPFIQEMGAKLEWGIPFETVLQHFGGQTHSQIIQRAVSTIVQTYRAGGNVSQVLETIGSNLKEIRQLRKERESQVYGEMVTGYIVFFVFLLVLVVLVRYLLPALTFSGSSTFMTGGTQSLSSGEIVSNYRSIFQWLVFVQSVFSGLVIGRLSEGELKAGFKHVALLFGIGYTVALVFM